MKSYPSIAASTGQTFREIPNAYVFDKLDGSNMRFEWSRKRGWHKYGTRTRMLDESDPVFGAVIPKFHSLLGPEIDKIAKQARWEGLVVFAEWYGPASVAGCHVDNKPEEMCLELIDANVHKKGFMDPGEYLKVFAGLPQAAFLGRTNWTRGFVKEVWEGKIEGVSFEGVVGKSGSGNDHDRVMAKAKTSKWISVIRSRYSAEEAEKLIAS